MQHTRTIESFHDAFVHDIQFDYYGTRMATCSSDQKVIIWEKEKDKDHAPWLKKCDWKAHNGPIYKVAWANPSFGNLLATCSFDKTVIIWAEQSTGSEGIVYVAICLGIQWKSVSQINVFKDRVVDVKFAPHKDKLILAAACGNGLVLIFRPKDILNVESWVPECEFQASFHGVTCISWSQCIYEPPMLAVGCCDKLDAFATSKAMEKEDLVQIWWPNEKTGRYDNSGRGSGIHHSRTITDVAWAPFIGRSFHILASISMDLKLVLWKVKGGLNKEKEWEDLKMEPISTFATEAIPRRLGWNVIGSVLVVSDEGSVVKAYKVNGKGMIQEIATISEQH